MSSISTNKKFGRAGEVAGDVDCAAVGDGAPNARKPTATMSAICESRFMSVQVRCVSCRCP
jgi:hypothetical protein